MIPFFPNKLAKKAILTYLAALAAISLLYFRYMMDVKFIIFGLLEVYGFFHFSSQLSQRWVSVPSTLFEKSIFKTSLIIREAWVILSYFFFIQQTGQPFEWEVGDAEGYHQTAAWLASDGWPAIKYWFFTRVAGISDKGYEMWLTIVYLIFGPNVLVTRIIKGFISSFTVILVFRLSSRTFGDKVGRMAAVFCMLMPNLIYYCGVHLKETEMVFLVLAFLERTDYLLRTGELSFKSLIFLIILGLLLFCFRTVLGAVAFLSFLLAIIFAPKHMMPTRKKFHIGCIVGVLLLFMSGGTIMEEVSDVWAAKDTNMEHRRTEQVSTTSWAKYATGTVMAPMIFVIPFATMVDVGQYAQQLIHGGNYVKNALGVFVLIAFFVVLFRKKNWRDFIFLGAYTIGYLVVLSFSAFANAERFHMPVLPILLMFAAYGVSLLDAKNTKFVNIWFYIVFLMEFAWAFFKLGGRGLL